VKHSNFMAILLAASALFAAPYGIAAEPAAKDPLEAVSAVLRQQTKREVRAFSTRDFGRDRFAGARSVLVPEDAAERLLRAVRAQLPPGYVAFVGTSRSLAEPPAEGVEVVVGPGKSQFDILRIAASDAVNYDMETEDLIKVLQKWDQLYGIDIVAAETDTIQLTLNRLPPDVLALAKEVYEFCPDIVDQGIGSVSALASEIKSTRRVYLWWD
jgi:hypothetical protein